MGWEDDSYLRSAFGWIVDVPRLDRETAERLAREVEQRFPDVTGRQMPHVSDPRSSCHTLLRRDAAVYVAEGLRHVGDRHGNNLVADIEIWADRVAQMVVNSDQPEFRIGLRYWSVTVPGEDSLAGARGLASIAEAIPYNLKPRLVDPTEWFMIWGDASTMAMIRRGLEGLSTTRLALAMLAELGAWEEWSALGDEG